MTTAFRWGIVAGAAVAAAALVRAWQSRARASAETAHREDVLNETVEESFPASDPPSHTPVVGSAAGV